MKSRLCLCRLCLRPRSHVFNKVFCASLKFSVASSIDTRRQVFVPPTSWIYDIKMPLLIQALKSHYFFSMRHPPPTGARSLQSFLVIQNLKAYVYYHQVPKALTTIGPVPTYNSDLRLAKRMPTILVTIGNSCHLWQASCPWEVKLQVPEVDPHPASRLSSLKQRWMIIILKGRKPRTWGAFRQLEVDLTKL